MSEKFFILTADCLGFDEAYNRAILEGYNFELLKSASIIANGIAFDEAINNVLPQCPDLDIGIQLNITQGKSLMRDLDFLTDKDGNFNNSWYQLLIKSFNRKDNTFLEQLEKEFRAQIEEVKSKTNVSFITSLDYIHSIPSIFELVCKLAKEYEIKFVRSNFENLYVIPDVFIHLTKNYIKNFLWLVVLDFLYIFNESKLEKYGLKTNTNFIGILYNSMMSGFSIFYGLKFLHFKNTIVECVIHPCRYEEGFVNNNFMEFQITKNKKLKEKIESLDYKITNYSKI